MPHGVLLTPAFQDYSDDSTTGFRMTVTASDPVDMSAAVFRFRALPLQPGQDDADAVFDGVCSPADLEEFPIDAPLESADPPWFRKTVIDLVFRSRTEVEEAWELIRNEVAVLVETLDTMDELTASAPVQIGQAAG